MTSNQTSAQVQPAIESVESFCNRLSQAFANDGFDVSVRPGDHLVDDAGADSLTVLTYLSHLQAFGVLIDLREFDAELLNVDTAYQRWLQGVALSCQENRA